MQREITMAFLCYIHNQYKTRGRQSHNNNKPQVQAHPFSILIEWHFDKQLPPSRPVAEWRLVHMTQETAPKWTNFPCSWWHEIKQRSRSIFYVLQWREKLLRREDIVYVQLKWLNRSKDLVMLVVGVKLTCDWCYTSTVQHGIFHGQFSIPNQKIYTKV